MYRHVNIVHLSVWSFVCFVSYYIRYKLISRYFLSSDESKCSTNWQKWFLACVSTSGLVWGMSVFFIFPEDAYRQQVLLIVILVILTSVTTITHIAYRWASVCFSFAALSPPIVKLILLNQEDLTPIALFLILFGIVIVSSSKYLESITDRMFKLIYENDGLLTELKLSNQDLTKKNKQLMLAKEELCQTNENLRQLATTDGLTGLASRRKFEAHIQIKWQRCISSNDPVSLLIIDLDLFRKFNDSYGHQKGDRCLIDIAQELNSITQINRQGNCLARLSGGQFIVFMMNCDLSMASSSAEYIRMVIEELRISRAEFPCGTSPWVTVSIGVATTDNPDLTSYNDLFFSADQALYQAKSNGRNQVCVFESTDAISLGGWG